MKRIRKIKLSNKSRFDRNKIINNIGLKRAKSLCENRMNPYLGINNTL